MDFFLSAKLLCPRELFLLVKLIFQFKCETDLKQQPWLLSWYSIGVFVRQLMGWCFSSLSSSSLIPKMTGYVPCLLELAAAQESASGFSPSQADLLDVQVHSLPPSPTCAPPHSPVSRKYKDSPYQTCHQTRLFMCCSFKLFSYNNLAQHSQFITCTYFTLLLVCFFYFPSNTLNMPSLSLSLGQTRRNFFFFFLQIS